MNAVVAAAEMPATLPPELEAMLCAIGTTPMHEAVTFAHLGERAQSCVTWLMEQGLVHLVNGNPRLTIEGAALALLLDS